MQLHLLSALKLNHSIDPKTRKKSATQETSATYFSYSNREIWRTKPGTNIKKEEYTKRKGRRRNDNFNEIQRRLINWEKERQKERTK